MLESFAAAFLNKFLGSYVENFDPNQLQVGIWNGDVKLKNLKLRKEALDELDLPVVVKSGILGELTMQVPWSGLKNKPVKIFIDNVFLLCEPKTWDSYDVKEDDESNLRLKMNKLEELEAMNSISPSASDNEKANESFTTNLVNKIVDNVQITVKNIHFRYEDYDCLFSEKPCSLGFSLSELSAVSTNEDWIPSFISITQKITKKMLSLDSLSFYFNTNNSETVFDEDLDVLIGKFQEAIQVENEDSENKYVSQSLVSPVSGSCKLSINKGGATDEQPHIDATLGFSSLSVELDDTQYQEALNIISKFQWFQRSWKFRKMRPKSTVSEDPKTWFKYTAQCVLNEIHEKNYKNSWEFIKERSQKKKAYIALWKQKLNCTDINTPLPDAFEEEKLELFHRELPLEDIRFFRALAKKEFLLEKTENQNQLGEKSLSESNNINESSKNGGWFSSWWSAPTDSTTDQDLVITEEQKQEFYDAIEWDENKSISEAINVPEDRVVLSLKNILGKGSLKLKLKNDDSKVGEMVFENSQTEIKQRPNSFAIDFNLFQFAIEDGSPNTLNKHIVKVNNGNSDEETPFFKFGFETNPLNSDADSALDLQLRSMSIYYHVHFFNAVMQFFKPQRKHYDTLNSIMSAAEDSMEAWSHQTRMGLEALLEDHKNIDINCDLQTPLIIIPLDAHTWDTPCLIVDAGHISVISELIPKVKIQDLKNLSVEEYNKLDADELQRLMFDRFKLSLDNAQLLIGSDIRSTIASLGYDDRENNFSVLEKTHLNLIVDVSIFPKALSFPKIKTTGNLPLLKLSLNDYQYKIIMQILDTCIPMGYDSDLSSGITNEYSAQKQIQGLLRKTLNDLGKLSDEEMKQKLLELNLVVESVEMNLKKCTDKDSMAAESVVSLFGSGLEVDLSKYAKEMKVLLGLNTLYLLDQSSGEAKNLVSSSNTKSSLFKIDLTRTQRIISYNNTLIEIFDQDICMDMSSLQINLYSKGILGIMNYMMTTFTDMKATELPSDILRHNDDTEEFSPQKLNLILRMDEIVAIFEDETGDLAKLSLSKGSIDCYALPEKVKVNGKLGKLELHDELHKNFNSYIRDLIKIEDDEVAEFTYETFDKLTNKEIYDSELTFKSSSVKVNFVEQSFGRLLDYMNNFQQMKGIYDRAREAAYDQAPGIDTINNIKLNILIKTPIVEFPTVVDPVGNLIDNMSFYLGEFYLQNNFLKDTNGNVLNEMYAGLRSIKVSSLFNTSGGKQSLSMVDNIDMNLRITCNSEVSDETPQFKVIGDLSTVHLGLTDQQVIYLNKMSSKITSIFSYQSTPNSFEDIEKDAMKANAVIALESDYVASQRTFDSSQEQKNITDPHAVQVDIVFNAPEFVLSLYDNTENSIDISKLSITRVKFLDTGFKFKMKNDSSFEGSSFFSAFTVEDTRENKENKHQSLVPAVSSQTHQFEATFSRQVLEKQKEIYDVTMVLDNLRVILAMDYLISLQLFLNNCALTDNTSASLTQSKEEFELLQSSKNSLDLDLSSKDNALTDKVKINFVCDVINPTVIILADPHKDDSEAIVFQIGRVVLTQQKFINISLKNVGMFTCNIDLIDKEHVRLIDDFDISLVYNDYESTLDKLRTTLKLDMERLVMRLALRDIRLALRIFNKAVIMGSEKGLYQRALPVVVNETGNIKFSKEFKLALARYAPSVLSSLSVNTQEAPALNQSTTEQRHLSFCDQSFIANFDGLRLVLIGDVSELPLLDFNIDSFDFDVKNWADDIQVTGSLSSYVNVFNYSKSDWEPLIEATPVFFKVFKGKLLDDAKYNVFINTNNLSEITLSSESILLLSKIPQSIHNCEEKFSRGDIKPYKIINETGADLEIWIHKLSGEKEKATLLKNNEIIPWEFEDWREVRKNLDTDNYNSTLGFRVANSFYGNWFKVNTKSELNELYKLQPPVDGVHDRLCCNISLNTDGVKIIKFQSPFTITNNTASMIELSVSNSDSIYIDSKKTVSVPFSFIYDAKYSIRPILDNENYQFSKRLFSWETLLKGHIFEKCENQNLDSAYYFQVASKYDKRERLAQVYPHMEVTISAPFHIQNLLPYDMKVELSSKNKKERYVCSIEQGKVAPIYAIDFSDFVFMRVLPIGTDYMSADYVLISAPDSSALAIEKEVKLVQKNNGPNLNLGLKYNGDGVKKPKTVRIYAPYIVLNRTERDLHIRDKNKTNIFSSKVSFENGEYVADPIMFSFDKFKEKNGAQIKMKETDWSASNTFDALEQNFELPLLIPNKTTQTELGLHISEALGKYKLTKIVTVSPRYIIKSEYEEDLILSETMSISEIVLEKDICVPLYKMSTATKKFCKLKFYGGSYSEPFPIGEIGIVYVKIFNKRLNKHRLLRVETVLDNATLFLTIKNSQNEWPYSIRNFTDETFLVYQRDPRILDSDSSYYTDANNDTADFNSYMYMRKPKSEGDGYLSVRGKNFEPIVYKVLPYTLMPFSWDFPSAKEKKIIIETRGAKRSIDLREIGNLKPFVIRKAFDDTSDSYVELNILADGPTQALVLSKYNPDTSLYKLKGAPSGTSINSGRSKKSMSSSRSQLDNESFAVSKEADYSKDGKNKSDLKIFLNFQGLGISVVNQRLDELMYISMKGIEVRYNDSKMYQSISWKLKWLQIDNQLFGTVFPNVIYPSEIHNIKEELDSHPFFSGSITKVNDNTRGLTYFKYATALLQEVTIKLDEEFIVELLRFIHYSQNGGRTYNHANIEENFEMNKVFFNYDKSDNHLRLPECTINVENNDIYFETLHIQPTVIHLSFMRSDGLLVEGDQGLFGVNNGNNNYSSNVNFDESSVVDITDEANETTGNKYNALINTLTMTLGNVSDAPIQLNSVLLENLKGSSTMLQGLIKEHYNGEFFRQLLKIVGYADVLGNPIGLFNNISSGVFDIFYKPYQGYFMNDNPEELGVSIAKGGLSFIKKSVFGFSDSFAKFTGSVAKGLTAATQDKDFQKSRLLQQRRNRLNQDSNGFTNGVSSLFSGISSGFTGVASNTMEGAKKDGASGFFKGLGKGLVGVPTKTAIGLLDMANNVSEEIKNSTKRNIHMDNIGNNSGSSSSSSRSGNSSNNLNYYGYGDEISSIRLPRYINHTSLGGNGNGIYLGTDFNEDGLIKPYNLRESQGQYWLKMCNGGQFINDQYIAHIVLPGKERILCVSQERVCEINIVSLKCISSVTIEEMCLVGAPIDDGRQIIIRVKNEKTFEIVNWKFPVPRKESRKYIIDRIIIAQNKALRYMDDRL